MNNKTIEINESTTKTVMLDNREISTKEFNETLENLKPNQRIVESGNHSFHIVERFFD